jgi:hypothetical protein
LDGSGGNFRRFPPGRNPSLVSASLWASLGVLFSFNAFQARSSAIIFQSKVMSRPRIVERAQHPFLEWQGRWVCVDGRSPSTPATHHWPQTPDRQPHLAPAPEPARPLTDRTYVLYSLDVSSATVPSCSVFRRQRSHSFRFVPRNKS